jgi:hypothetical protein
MPEQLALATTTAISVRTWKFDDRTKEIGRRGISSARLALAAARGHLAESTSPSLAA